MRIMALTVLMSADHDSVKCGIVYYLNNLRVPVSDVLTIFLAESMGVVDLFSIILNVRYLLQEDIDYQRSCIGNTYCNF